jgi:hypothetical protein
VDQVPTDPYVTAAEFAAHPTYLDLDDLRSGISDPAAQTAELTNLLLMASAWADGECNQPLGAHQVVAQTPGRTDRDGILRVHAFYGPVLSVSSLAYGRTPFSLMSTAAPQWAPEGETQNLLFPIGPGPWWPGARLSTSVTYVAGWVSTTLAAAASAGATSLTVTDPTGILPGATYRLWEPGAEESVTVSSAFVPPAVSAPAAPVPVPLAAPTVHDHTAGSGWSGLPSEIRLAVILYAVSQLMRPDTSSEDSYPDTSLSSGTREKDPRKDGSGLVAEAQRLLNPYTRVR